MKHRITREALALPEVLHLNPVCVEGLLLGDLTSTLRATESLILRPHNIRQCTDAVVPDETESVCVLVYFPT